MYFALMGKLDARRKNLAKGIKDEADKGFTLIELLVVVIIIGILAAIAIPVYLNVQNNAKDSGVQSDLTNAKTAVVASYTNDNTTTTPPALTKDALGSYGFTNSASYTATGGMTYAANSSASSFCIQATSSTTKQFHISTNKGAISGPCGASSDW